MLEQTISQTRPLQIKSFLPFNFSITNICVAIRLADDRTRMGSIYFQLSPSINLNNTQIANSISKVQSLIYCYNQNLNFLQFSKFRSSKLSNSESLTFFSLRLKQSFPVVFEKNRSPISQGQMKAKIL